MEINIIFGISLTPENLDKKVKHLMKTEFLTEEEAIEKIEDQVKSDIRKDIRNIITEYNNIDIKKEYVIITMTDKKK